MRKFNKFKKTYTLQQLQIEFENIQKEENEQGMHFDEFDLFIKKWKDNVPITDDESMKIFNKYIMSDVHNEDYSINFHL